MKLCRRFFIFSILLFSTSLVAQPMRCFEFTVACGHNNWQDTSFVACASNPAVVDSVLANLQRPMQNRKFISGPIASGNGGFNINAGHSFRWHFVPNQWELAEFAIELCDGCPFTDVDTDTAYWLGTVQSFCPWSSKPVREVSAPSSTQELVSSDTFIIYPNPASRSFVVQGPMDINTTYRMFNLMGKAVTEQMPPGSLQPIDVSSLEEGIYILRITTDNHMINKRIYVGKFQEN